MMLNFIKHTALWRLFFVLFSICLLLLSCENEAADQQNPPEENTPDSLNKIMPLGASRVQGLTPFFESYRYPLWKALIDGGWDFDFIGTEKEIGSYPSYEGFSFDRDHQGNDGWTSGQILDHLPTALSEVPTPDIVLFSSPGGNDILDELPYEDVLDNVNDIIDFFQDLNPDIVILIEQLAPGKSSFMTPELTAIFDQAVLDVETIAQAQTNDDSQVMPVNMFEGFEDRYLADDIHYNDEGAEFIAQRYYEALQSILE